MKKKIKLLMLAIIFALSAGQLGYAQTSYATTITLDGQSIIKEKNSTTTTIGQGTVVQVTDLQEHILSGSSQNGNGVNYNRILVKNGMVFEVEFPSHYTNIEKSDGPFSIITGANGKTRLRFTGAGGFHCRYETVVGGVTQRRRISGHVNYYGVLQLGHATNSSTQDAPSTLIVVSSNATTQPLGQVSSGTLFVTEDQVLSVPSGKFIASEWRSSLDTPENFVLLQENIYQMKVKDILLQAKASLPGFNGKIKLRLLISDDSNNDIQDEDGTITLGGISKQTITIRDERVTDKKVTSIQLNPPQLNLAQGQESTITATILPQDASNTTLNWQSSHPALVSVDQQGKVRVIGTPNQDTPVTISATASDGSNVVGTMQVLLEGKKYTITAESNNTAWGAVNPATQTVNANTQVTVTATAQQGFNFVGWFENGNLVHNQTTYTFNVTANRTLEARFAAQPKPKFTITTSVKDNLGGSASPQTQEIEQGQAATVTATAQQGFNFVGWFENGNLVHNQTTYTFNVTANRTLEARFVQLLEPETILPHLVGLDTAPLQKETKVTFQWEEMPANAENFKLTLINSQTSSTSQGVIATVSTSQAELQFNEAGTFSLQISFEVAGTRYVLSYDNIIVK